MANKKQDKFLALYPEDFEGRIWEEVCEVLDIKTSTAEVRIYFTEEDVVALEQQEEL